jgi:hypothetical protein
VRLYVLEGDDGGGIVVAGMGFSVISSSTILPCNYAWQNQYTLISI